MLLFSANGLGMARIRCKSPKGWPIYANSAKSIALQTYLSSFVKHPVSLTMNTQVYEMHWNFYMYLLYAKLRSRGNLLSTHEAPRNKANLQRFSGNRGRTAPHLPKIVTICEISKHAKIYIPSNPRVYDKISLLQNFTNSGVLFKQILSWHYARSRILTKYEILWDELRLQIG